MMSSEKKLLRQNYSSLKYVHAYFWESDNFAATIYNDINFPISRTAVTRVEICNHKESYNNYM